MFVRPEQVAALTARHSEISRARVLVTRKGDADHMIVQIEATSQDIDFGASIQELLKLRGEVEIVSPDSLPKDGIVIEDQRKLEG
jgi:phenylacetate-CoA ligase